MNKYKILALIGEAGSGKDTLMQRILIKAPDLHEIISCTTRKPREGEVHGKNYFFLTEEEFNKKTLNGDMLETTHKNWHYGTSIDSLSKNTLNIGVFNPDGIYSLLKSNKVDLFVIYVKARSKTRLMRQLTREENPNVDEIIRRYDADKKDFKELYFQYFIVDNETEKDLETSADIILQLLQQQDLLGKIH